MFCDQCGTQLVDTQKFCPACGKPLAGIPAGPVRSTMEGHIRLLAILWLAISGLRLLPSLFLLGVGHGRFHFPPIPHFVLPMMGFFGGFILVSAILGLITGWGLLERQPWARPMAILMGCLALFAPPFGTALGAYTLWVMLSHDAENEYRRLSRPPVF